MPYLVRKIMRSSNVPLLEDWPENTLLGRISADVSTNEFRSKDSELSTWRIESMEELDQAAIAVALSGSRIEDIQLMAMDQSFIEKTFKIGLTEGETLAKRLRGTHRDIQGVTHDSLDILLVAYKDAADNKRCVRYLTQRLKELIKAELDIGEVDIEAASKPMKKDLNALC